MGFLGFPSKERLLFNRPVRAAVWVVAADLPESSVISAVSLVVLEQDASKLDRFGGLLSPSRLILFNRDIKSRFDNDLCFDNCLSDKDLVNNRDDRGEGQDN